MDIDVIYPVFSILDPEVTFSLPAYQTGCGISDMFVHAFERYFTVIKNVDVTDRFCEAIMKSIVYNAPKVMANLKDYDARAEIMWAGSLAHNNLAGTGRVGDFANHMIEHELSGFNDVAHGAGLAILVPNWMKHVYKRDPERFVKFAVNVFNIENNFYNPEETIMRGIDALRAFYNSLGMPSTLTEIGIKEQDFPAIAKKVKRFDIEKGTVGNSYPLNEKDILAILSLSK